MPRRNDLSHGRPRTQQGPTRRNHPWSRKRGRTSLQRFEEKYEVDENGCWIWMAARCTSGYALFRANGKQSRGHLWAYEHHIGPRPEGLDLDHLCRVRHCVNPEHLEPVSRRENCVRGDCGAHYGERTHCSRGHEYNEKNTRISKSGWRECRVCARERARGRKRRGAA